MHAVHVKITYYYNLFWFAVLELIDLLYIYEINIYIVSF